VGDGVDFSGSRGNLYDPDDEVDAIANRGDHLFKELQGNANTPERAHLIFSHDDQISIYTTPAGTSGGGLPIPFSVLSSGPVTLSNGNIIGGAGELSYETAFAFTPASSQGVWATRPEINAMPLPHDVDGVEVWGPEPAFTADSDKYSMDVDFFSGTSVWNASGTPYISQATIAAAVTSLLGPLSGVLPYPTHIDGTDAINLDALMVNDRIRISGTAHDTFDRDPDTPGVSGDQIIFSIRQIIDSNDPTGYYATGSELFVLDASTGVSFLTHGGHVWDKAYALSDLSLSASLVDGHAVIDINAIEAISAQVIPEPSSAILLLTAGMGLALTKRRR